MKKWNENRLIHRLKAIPLPILVISIIFLLGTSAVAANHFHSQGKKPKAPDISEVDSPQNIPMEASPAPSTEQLKSSVNTPTPKLAPPDPCPGLEKAVADKEFTYLDTGNNYISIIHKDIYDRYDSNTDSYNDLDTIRTAVAYANSVLDGIYGDIANKFNYQKSKGCHYSNIIRHFNLPAVSDYPSNWAMEALNALQSSWGQ